MSEVSNAIAPAGDERRYARVSAWLGAWRPSSDRAALALWLSGSALALLLLKVSVAVGISTAIACGVCVGALSLLSFRASSQQLQRGAVRGMPRLLRIAHWIDRHELYLLIALSPFFLVPLRPFVFGIALIPLLSLARWLTRGYVTRASPLHAPLLALLVMLVPAFLFAADAELAMPKLVGLLFGLGLYFAILNLRANVSVSLLSRALALVGLAVALIALVSTSWPVVGKLSIYADVYAVLPRLIREVPSAVSRSNDINPNNVGGALAWIVPYLLALWLGQQPQPARQDARRWLWQIFLIASIVISSAVLFLTQSRGAIVAFTLVLLILIARHARPLRWLLPSAGAVVLIALFIFAPSLLNEPTLETAPDRVSHSAEISLHGRVTIWQQAIEAIHVYPLAGVGLNGFELIRNQLGVASTSELEQQRITHAHNLFLQAAIDFGLPGLSAYTALLTGVFGILLSSMRQDGGRERRTLATALFAGLLAHQIFGLTDAITLGAKPGFILWIFLGTAAWLFANERSSTENDATSIRATI